MTSTSARSRGFARVGFQPGRAKAVAPFMAAALCAGTLLPTFPASAAAPFANVVTCGVQTPIGGEGEAQIPVAADPLPGSVAADTGEAIQGLGSALPEAASVANMTPAEFADKLSDGDGFAVDRCGVPLHIDPLPTASAAGAAAGAGFDTAQGTITEQSPVVARASVTTPPVFHSRPGSAHTLFLDFDGADMDGRAWAAQSPANSVDAPAYDTDGDPTSFSDAEQAAIEEVWKRVAEDYAPFNVDVTTEAPSTGALDRTDSGDANFGGTVVFVGTNGGNALWTAACGRQCGGVAYIGVMDYTGSDHEMYQPALVFQTATRSAAAMGEAASHESGHNMGLSHDGAGSLGYYSGTALWAPIMGVAYSAAISQWSKGEYTGANQKQDDLVIIAASGLGRVQDEAGNGPTTEATLTADAPRDGTIGTASDVDWYQVPTGGRYRVSATTSTAANLDVNLSVYAADGVTLLASANPTAAVAPFGTGRAASGMSADLGVTIPDGGFVVVDGVGSGSALSGGYSDYGSLGRYTLALGAESSDLAISDSAWPSGVTGTAYSQQLSATGGTAPLTWSATGLPNGFTISTSGKVSGSPTFAATSAVQIRVTDATGFTATASRTLEIKPAPSDLRARWGASANPMRVGASAVGSLGIATGGKKPYVWSLAAGSLPAGVAMGADGKLSGTPTDLGAFSFTPKVTDATGYSVSAVEVTGEVKAPISTDATRTVDTLVRGARATITLTASNGIGAVSWKVISGGLPKGVALTKTGQVVGLPTVAGTFTSTLQAADINSKASSVLTWVVGPGAPVAVFSTTTVGAVDLPLNVPITVQTGTGNGTVSWAAGDGNPAWATVNADGTITGTPTVAGWQTVKAIGTDEQGLTVTAAVPIKVLAPMAVTNKALTPAKTSASYSATLTATNMIGRTQWTVTSGSLPAGLSLAAGTGKITGRPTAAGTGDITFTVTDTAGRTASATFVITVTAATTSMRTSLRRA